MENEQDGIGERERFSRLDRAAGMYQAIQPKGMRDDYLITRKEAIKFAERFATRETATLTTQLNEMREALRELCEAAKDARLLYGYGVVQMPTDYEDSRANQTRCEGEAKLMLSKIDFAQTKAKALLDKSRED